MAEEKKKEASFVVRDRRMFTPEGKLREEYRESATPRSPAPDVPAMGDADTTSAGQQTAQERASTSVRKEYAKQAPGVYKADFETLVISLSTTAMYQLGLVREPKGSPPPVDLDAARHTIDMLGVIEEKTRGNLTVAEQQLLDQALYDLRMSYLAIQDAVKSKKKSRDGQ